MSQRSQNRSRHKRSPRASAPCRRTHGCPPQPQSTPSLQPPSSQPLPLPRVGDLLWCRESKRTYTLWWPAMVTYDPNLATLYRTNTYKGDQIHVQYFGISAIRGWVSKYHTEPLTSLPAKPPLDSVLKKKLKAEYNVAVLEAKEALSLTHKERKLKFIFSYDSCSAKETVGRGGGGSRQVNDGVKEEGERGRGRDQQEEKDEEQSQKKLGKRRRRGGGGGISVKKTKNDILMSASSPSVLRRGSEGGKEMLVSLNISGLGVNNSSPDSNQPSAQHEESFEVSVEASLSVPALGNKGTSPSPNELPTKRVPKPNRLYPVMSRRSLHPESSIKLDLVVPAKKLLPVDYGSETGSEASGMSIASAILTPPSSCSEGVSDEILAVEKREWRGEGEGEGERNEEKKPKIEKGEHERESKRSKPKYSKRSKSIEGPSFQEGVCAICDDSDTNLLACQGCCFQTFHLDCLGLIQPPCVQFVCDECESVSKQCFVCSKSDGTLEKCSKPKCKRYYHLSCIEGNSLFVFNSQKSTFVCPLHSCTRCAFKDLDETAPPPRGSSLVQCIRCPLALHKPHCLIAGCRLVSATQMICYLHLHIEQEMKLYRHINMDTCMECGVSGSLYCCDFCSSAYHRECLEEDQKPVEEVEVVREGEGEEVKAMGEAGGEKWLCPICRQHDLPTYGSIVYCKFGVWRWWPAQIVKMEDVPANIQKKKPGECMFVVRFCGTHDYCWIYHGRTLSYSIDCVANPTRASNTLDSKRPFSTGNQYKIACKEAAELYTEQMKLIEQKRLPKQESNAYVKIKSNKYLVPRPQLSDDDLHSMPCQCTPANPCDDDSICVNRAIKVECNPKTCPVGLFCHNQRMRQCQCANTVPFYTGSRGWGLKAGSDIEQGEFVVEYVGEVLDVKMCHDRLQKAHENQIQHFYMLTLDSRNGLVIDAKEKSNHARFINHSCNPNCETQKWTVGHETRIGIFSNKFITAGTELTFDYQLDSLGNGRKECLCGSRNCSGYIGLRSKVEPKPKLPKPKQKVKAKPRPATTQKRKNDMYENAPPVDISHENLCFVCGDGGELLCCDQTNCPKVYHLGCIGRKIIPREKWFCPWHYCKACCKKSVVFCSTCPTSYCHKHKHEKLVQVDNQQKCIHSCLNPTSNESNSPKQTSTTNTPNTTHSIINPNTSTSNISTISAPQLPPPPPPLLPRSLQVFPATIIPTPLITNYNPSLPPPLPRIPPFASSLTPLTTPLPLLPPILPPLLPPLFPPIVPSSFAPPPPHHPPTYSPSLP